MKKVKIPELSSRQLEILQDLADGLTVVEVGIKRNISKRTVESHCREVLGNAKEKKIWIVLMALYKVGIIK
jgi:DNA-binding NarL/FixJ family response regulator